MKSDTTPLPTNRKPEKEMSFESAFERYQRWSRSNLTRKYDSLELTKEFSVACFCCGPDQKQLEIESNIRPQLTGIRSWTASVHSNAGIENKTMFSIESAVHHLKPDYVLRHVLQAEENQWSRAHLGADMDESIAFMASYSSCTSLSAETGDTGKTLLRHGTSVKKIHDHFSQLEFRKCCLHLAGRKSTFQIMRVVHPSGPVQDDGSAKKATAPHTFVTHLEDKELRAFKHAYLCAAYPVLAAPDPPSPFSPSPVNPYNKATSPRHSAEASGSTTRGTPYSLHDSGLEESEDLAFIPSESICAHLQRAFHLTDEKFRDYRYLINKTYVRKSAQKLLAEELAGQLAVLENNCHPFYKHQDFVPPMGYDIWRKAEYNHITELLGKFWHYALPFPRNAEDLISELHSVHEDYRILLTKLLVYERDFHRQAEEEGGMLVSPLSTASVRLLKEFGLRYGVGEQYRRILYLDQISMDFSPSLWYLRHVLSVVNSISDLLPPNKRALAMVKKEVDMLHGCLLRLATQVSKAMEQMKSLFPHNKPAGGVELLITLLQRIRHLRLYLKSTSLQQLPSLAATLTEIIQGLFFQTYERCKTVIRTELRHSRDIHICPRMMNAVIMEVRNEVLDYKNNFEAVFKPYMDITVMAARAFYSLMMKDVETLCHQEKLRESAIDLRMLALIHRLNQLDHDWSAYMETRDQLWRLLFQPHVAQWGLALQQHVQDLVVETIAGDAFVTQQLQLANGYTPQSTGSSSSPHTNQSVSFTPSINSAFNSISSIPGQSSSLPNHYSGGPERSDTPASNLRHGTEIQQHMDGSENVPDFLCSADKRRPCSSVPVFTDKPAIVRVMSEAKMSDQSQVRCLQAASAMEDLTNNSEKFAVIRELTGADKVEEALSGSEKSEAADHLSNQKSGGDQDIDKVSDGAGAVQMEISTPTESDDDDSPDEDFTFPPLADVTDMNISDSSLSFIEKPIVGWLSHSILKANGKAKRSREVAGHKKDAQAMPGSSRVPTQRRQRLLQSLSQENEAEKRKGKLGMPAGDQERRQSCPLPLERQAVEKERRAFQPISEKIHHANKLLVKPSVVSASGSDGDHPFLQSAQSTLYFPSPTLSRDVIIPVSGSNIDLVVLLQRTLAFGQTLCQAVFPKLNHGGTGIGGSLAGGGVNEGEFSIWRSLEYHERCVHLNTVQVLCQGIGVYVDNMLCLDLCAVPKDVARRVIGSTLVDHAVRQQHEGRIWGCRHQLQGLLTCHVFHNRKATYLSERYEPVTQKMCVRINNVMACQEILAWCDKETEACLHGTAGVSAAGTTGARSMDADFTSSWQSQVGSMENRSMGTGNGDPSGQRRQWLERTSTHLMSVWSALCRLLAFRINLFLHDGLTVLLNLKTPSMSIATCLSPLTTFLRAHLDALSTWLYSRSFRRVIEFLWIYIVQDIEKETCKLSMDKSSKLTPHILLQSLTHLMRFMNNEEKGITKELLLSQADDVTTKLQLFTLSTLHLIALYQLLVEKYCEVDPMSQDEATVSSIPMRALHKLQKDLQTRRKCFSGAQLSYWLVQNGDLFLSPDELSLCGGVANIGMEGALSIAQQLLDLHVIIDVESFNAGRSRGSSTLSSQQYPEVSLHKELHSSSAMNVSSECGTPCNQSSSDMTPCPTTSTQPPQNDAVSSALAHSVPSTATNAQQSQIAHSNLLDEPEGTYLLTVPSIGTDSSKLNPADKTDVEAAGSGDLHSTLSFDCIEERKEDITNGGETFVQDDRSEAISDSAGDLENSVNEEIVLGKNENDRDESVSAAQVDYQMVSSEMDSVNKVSEQQEVKDRDTCHSASNIAENNQITTQQSADEQVLKKTGNEQFDFINEQMDPSDGQTDHTEDQTDDTDKHTESVHPSTDSVDGIVDSIERRTDFSETETVVADPTQQIVDISYTEGAETVDAVHQCDAICECQTSVTETIKESRADLEPAQQETDIAESAQTLLKESNKAGEECSVAVDFYADQQENYDGVPPQTSSDFIFQSATDVDVKPDVMSADDAVISSVATYPIANDDKKLTSGAESFSVIPDVTAEESSGMEVSFSPTFNDTQPTCGEKSSGVKDPVADKSQGASGIKVSDFEDSGVAVGQDSVRQQKDSKNSIMAKLAAQIPDSAKMAHSYSFPTYTDNLQCPPGEGSLYDLDMTSICGTPMSFNSFTPLNSVSSLFDGSSQKFYFMPPNPLSMSSYKHDQKDHRFLNVSATLSQLDHSLLHLKKSAETIGLAEKCFVLKITPVSILMTIYVRRKTDKLARTFLQQLPNELLQHLSSGVEMQSKECSVL